MAALRAATVLNAEKAIIVVTILCQLVSLEDAEDLYISMLSNRYHRSTTSQTSFRHFPYPFTTFRPLFRRNILPDCTQLNTIRQARQILGRAAESERYARRAHLLTLVGMSQDRQQQRIDVENSCDRRRSKSLPYAVVGSIYTTSSVNIRYQQQERDSQGFDEKASLYRSSASRRLASFSSR